MNSYPINLLPGGTQATLFKSNPVRVTGRTLFAVSIRSAAFIGTVHIQATLVPEPSEVDWFDAVEPVDFSSQPSTGEACVGKTFLGNYTYLRATITPRYPDTGPQRQNRTGSVTSILLSA